MFPVEITVTLSVCAIFESEFSIEVFPSAGDSMFEVTEELFTSAGFMLDSSAGGSLGKSISFEKDSVCFCWAVSGDIQTEPAER